MSSGFYGEPRLDRAQPAARGRLCLVDPAEAVQRTRQHAGRLVFLRPQPLRGLVVRHRLVGTPGREQVACEEIMRLVGRRIQANRFLEGSEGLLRLTLHEQQVTLRDVGLRQARLELERPTARDQRQLEARRIDVEAPDARIRQRIGEPGLRLGKLRVGLHRAAEQRGRLRQRRVGAVAQQRLAAQVQVVRLGVARAAALEQLDFLLRQRQAQRTDQLLRDLRLRGEHVLEAAVDASARRTCARR